MKSNLKDKQRMTRNNIKEIKPNKDSQNKGFYGKKISTLEQKISLHK